MEDTATFPAPALVIRWSRWRQLAMIALSSGLIALVVIGWPTFAGGWKGLPAAVMFACGIAIFTIGALAMVMAIVRLATRAVTGQIDDIGIYWARWSARTIPWSAIEAYGVAPHPTEPGVEVVNLLLQNPADWPPDRRLARFLNHRRLAGCGDLTLDLRGTDRSISDVEDRLRLASATDLNLTGELGRE